jgi:aspartyl-tRNA(Asn)/glutamyl-tRNA(Gln) amidotransferase subunit C
VPYGPFVQRRHAPDRHRPIAPGLSAIIERMADLSRSDVEHVAYLARLGLTDAELTRLEVELNHILDQYAILAGLPTDDIPPTAQTIELENILREDVVKPSLPVEAVLRNAPARQGDFIVVPAILDER